MSSDGTDGGAEGKQAHPNGNGHPGATGNGGTPTNGNGSQASPEQQQVQPVQSDAYDPIAEGMAFGGKEFARVYWERADPPYLAKAIDLGGSGAGYDEYGQAVLEADDPYQKLNDDDLAAYGPPAE